MPYSDPEKEKAYKHEWHIRNRERLNKKANAYYCSHKKQHAINTTRWKHENKEHCNNLSRKKYAQRTACDDKYKETIRQRQRKHYLAHREEHLARARAERGPKYIARYKARNAIKQGIIIKSSFCKRCFKPSIRMTMHHHDYSKPLDVVFLCSSCHGLEKRKNIPSAVS